MDVPQLISGGSPEPLPRHTMPAGPGCSEAFAWKTSPQDTKRVAASPRACASAPLLEILASPRRGQRHFLEHTPREALESGQ